MLCWTQHTRTEFREICQSKYDFKKPATRGAIVPWLCTHFAYRSSLVQSLKSPVQRFSGRRGGEGSVSKAWTSPLSQRDQGAGFSLREVNTSSLIADLVSIPISVSSQSRSSSAQIFSLLVLQPHYGSCSKNGKDYKIFYIEQISKQYS